MPQNRSDNYSDNYPEQNAENPAPGGNGDGNGRTVRILILAVALAVTLIVGVLIGDVVLNKVTAIPPQPTLPPVIAALATQLNTQPSATATIITTETNSETNTPDGQFTPRAVTMIAAVPTETSTEISTEISIETPTDQTTLIATASTTTASLGASTPSLDPVLLPTNANAENPPQGTPNSESSALSTPLVLPTTAPVSTLPALPITETLLPDVTPIIMIVTSTATALPSDTPTFTPTLSPTPCAPPTGWLPYIVQDGDTLFGFQLGSKNETSVQQLREANCLSNNLIYLGQVVYLPPGVAENAPKSDDSSAGGSRPANCPCTLTIRPGWRLEQIAAAADKLPLAFSGKQFLKATNASAAPTEYGFLASRPGGQTLEGFMLPGTYLLQNDTSAEAFRDQVLTAFGEAVNADMQAAASAKGLTFWEAVVLAGIVQRESYDAEGQKLIASMFLNRRAKEMALGTYVTIQYPYGTAGNWWPYPKGAMLKADSPYALTRYKGLPPTAIANPGLSAITAVLYAPATDYLYFANDCAGRPFFTADYAEFQAKRQC